jgi:hypothetical protein
MQYITKTGKEVIINFADFETADELKTQIELELLKININIGDLFKQKELNSETINSIKNAILILDSSKEIKRLVFQCLGRSRYDGIKITLDTFKNDMDAIGEYNTIKLNCIIENLRPFFIHQLSELTDIIQVVKSSLKSPKE